MLLGPVFRAELLRTARRKRYYVMRLLYGLLLLFVIWASYQGMIRGRETISIAEAATFALDTFIAFAVIQLIAILMLIPALFGGAIADEKQRKTLHYLMASRLTSFEIVVDKVLGRAPHVAVFLGLGLPVVCLLGLIGGVPPEYVAIAYVGTFSTATMAVALTVLVSTMARKVRQSVLISYILLLGWQLVPIILHMVCRRGLMGLFPSTYDWIEPVNVWVGDTSPLFVYVTTVIRLGPARNLTTWAYERIAWMVGLQLASAALLVGLAVWQLRPAFRRHEATQPRRKWFEGRKTRNAKAPRWYDRPECGIDAMAWKERYFARTDVFTKLVVLPATIMLTVFMVLVVGIDETLPRAVAALWRGGLLGWGNGAEELVKQIRVFSAWYVAIWMLAVAGASASSVAIEREEDTWVSLTSTPLTGWEILRGKALGAIWAQRGFGMIPLGLWTIGLVTGSVHPLGFLGAVLAFGVVTWMVAAVGVHASLKATTTSKALGSTIGWLVVLYGYPFFLILAVLVRGNWENYTTVLGLPPRLVVGSLMTYREFAETWRFILNYPWWNPVTVFGAFGLILLTIYTVVAAMLTRRSVRNFDRWLDRPQLSREAGSVLRPAPLVGEIEPVLQH